MSEETNPTASRGRAQRQGPDESGGGMKMIAILLALLAAGLGFGLYKASSNAATKAEEDAKRIGTLSNEVAELRTRLVSERSDFTLVQSNLHAQLDRRTADLNHASNRVVQTTLRMNDAKDEMHAALARLPAQATALTALEAERARLLRETEIIPALEQQIAGLKQKLTQGQFDMAALQETLSRARFEKSDLEQKLNDPAFLRVQIRRAEAIARNRERTTAGQRADLTDRRVRLDLQADGTVRPAGTPPPSKP